MKKLHKLHFGPAGYPISCKKKKNIDCIKYTIEELKLDGMEIEFTYGIKIANKEEIAEYLKNEAKDFVVTAHAPYYINLNTDEKTKFEKSIKMIYDSAKIIYELGGYSITFHPGWYMKSSKDKAYERVKEGIKKVVNQLKDEGIDIWIRPETMEMESKFGDLDEVIRLSQEIENTLPCIDFAHLRYRYKNNDENFFRSVLEKLENELGKEILNNMHIHMSGILLDKKGTHINLRESDIPWEKILILLKEFNVKGIVISESPNIEEDAILMKEYYRII